MEEDRVGQPGGTSRTIEVTAPVAGTFDDFVASRSAALIRTAYLLTGDWHLAEDLLQTALMRCYGHWSRIEAPESYVRRAMVMTVTGWRRRRWLGEVPTGDLPHDPDQADDLDLRTDVLRLLAELGPRQRAVVVLRYYEDLSEAEVADLLGITVGTVKSQAARALARLRTSPRLQSMIEEESS
jgi:RNA polymerase sigma-70 factor (sigma-E family)